MIRCGSCTGACAKYNIATFKIDLMGTNIKMQYENTYSLGFN